jgi:hypothetical protein
VLEGLAAKGLLQMGRGRVGLRLTQAGLVYLDHS